MQTTLDVSLPIQEGNDIVDKFTKITTAIQTVKTQMDTIKQAVKELEKLVKAEQKKTAKVQKTTKEKSDKKKPSGFAAPVLISDALCEFLSLEKGTKMPRTTVAQKLHEYIKEKKLQSAEDGRIIKPNQELKEMLNIDDTVELNYFNLQRYMNPHFNKVDVVLS